MKFFENLKKKRELRKAKIKYFKKQEKNMFFISTLGKSHPKLMKTLKVGMLGVIPVALILTGSYLGIKEMQNKDDNPFDSVINIDENDVTRRVYLLSQDNDTVPITININSMNSIHEEILTLFNLLKVDSKVTSDSFKGVIPSTTRLVSFTLEEGLLSLNLSKDLLNYEANVSKEKLLDSITYTMIQFDEVDEIELLIEDELFVSSLNCSRGINVDKSYTINSISNKKLMTYFYEKEIDNKSYYLPKSIYVDKLEEDNLTFYEGSKEFPSASSGLKKLSIYKQLSNKQEASSEFAFNVNELALVEENLMNKSLYDMILLSLDIMGLDKKVSFNYEGESLMVEGIISEEEYEVSSIVYNEIEAI